MNPVDDDETDTTEEDWSSILANTTGSAYKNYDCVEIVISSSTCLKLDCVQSLTPIDMLALSNGSGDATGNKVWTGAYFFISTFIYPSYRTEPSFVIISQQSRTPPIVMELSQLRTILFHNKIILELGCGTGVSGLSLLASGLDNQIQEASCLPAWVVFTDGDEHTLSLCRKNVETNLPKECYEKHYSFAKLTWGDEESIESLRIHMNCIGQGGIQKLDTILATDILYDLESLRPIFHTVHALLVDQGFFVLALVPRLSLHESQAMSHILEIEERIELEAQLYNMILLYRIRPREDVCLFMADKSFVQKGILQTQEAWESMDVSILIFQCNRKKQN